MFFKLFSVLYRNQNVRQVSADGKKKLPPRLSGLLAILPISILMSGLLGLLASAASDAETLSSLCIVVVSVAQLFVLFISLFSMTSTLYDSPDTPFLNTLPIRTSTVFFAKFMLVYVNALELMSSFTILPLLTMSIVYAALGGAMSYAFFPLVIVIALAAPVLPIFIVTLLTMPLCYAGTYLKSKPVLKTVLAITLYALAMVGYCLLIYFMSGNADNMESGAESILTEGMLSGLATFAKVMYPNKVLIEYSLGISAGVNFGISFGITAGMLIIMLLLSGLFYRRINQRKLQSQAAQTSHQASFKQSSMTAALVKKDFKSIVRNTNLAMSSFGTIVICPIITVLMYFVSGMQGGSEMSPLMTDMLSLNYLVLYSALFLAGPNMLAMLAYTREGMSFLITRTLPINPKDSLKAKFIVTLIPIGIILVIEVILALALYKVHIANALLYVAFILLLTTGATALHICADMRFGNVNWSTRQDLQQASRENKGSLLIVFAVLGIAMIGMVVGMVLASVSSLSEVPILSELAVYAIYWAIMLALAAVMTAIGLITIKNNGERWYALIGERKFIPRAKRNKTTISRGGLLK